MLEIVLLILKIAGIIFVAVLGILIVALFCVLFVPVRYRGDFSVADAENGEKKKICAKLRAFWFLRFVGVYVSFEETLRVRVRVFIFTLMDTAKEKKGREKKKSRKDQKEKEGAAGEESDKTRAEAAGSKETVNGTCEITGSKEVANKAAEDTESKETAGETAEDVERQKTVSKEKRKIGKRISNILQTISDFCDKLKGIKEKAGKIKELWNSEHMVSARRLLGKQFVYLLKHTKPGRLEGYLRFGFDDPSTTGYAMAVYGILYPVWSPKLSVEPDFEEPILDCHIGIKGKIRAWHFMRTALRLFFSGDVRRIINDVRKL